MPMAGRGSRFAGSQNTKPKPFLLIKKKPMFTLASMSMPKAKMYIYIYLNKYSKFFNNSVKFLPYKNIISIKIKKVTKGQAQTCLLAKKYIKNDEIIFIHSCDSYINFNKNTFKALIKKNDVIIFTNKPNTHNLKNINSFGWVSLNKNKITNISCKRKASNQPTNDHIIVGSFAFKNKNIFLKCIQSLIKRKVKIKNEYYLDMAVKEALRMKMNVHYLDVKEYLSWGTPYEFEKSKYFKIKNSKIIPNI